VENPPITELLSDPSEVDDGVSRHRSLFKKFSLMFDDFDDEAKYSLGVDVFHLRIMICLWIAVTFTMDSAFLINEELGLVFAPLVLTLALTFTKAHARAREAALAWCNLLGGLYHLLVYLVLGFTPPDIFTYALFPLFIPGMRFILALIPVGVMSLVLVLFVIILEGQIVYMVVFCVILVLAILNLAVAAYFVKRLSRELVIIQYSLTLKKLDSQQRLRVVIPPAIASLMRRGQYPAVYSCPDVGLGCVSVCNLEQLVQAHSCAEITSMLNEFHSEVARLTPSEYIDRIKTVGALDLLAVGLPTGNRGNVEFLARWALDVFPKLKPLQLCMFELHVCIVLHCGDVVAGVMGKKKLRFDMWGVQMTKFQSVVDDVRKFDQHGVYVTSEAYELLREKFHFYHTPVKTVSGTIYRLLRER